MKREFNELDRHEVLYVEDHPTNVRLMQALFRHRPHLELVVAVDGRQAREIAQRLQPSLLLLDLRLPDCDGVSLLQELRQVEGWETLPAVVVTAEQGFEIRGTGFSELWPKPIDLAFVLGRLDALIAHTVPA
ncbi:MAG TPA: response regulator [Rhizobacter sp.]|nr:response regulator [Rhizobacter sp.]